jgi:hypothetical protein
MFWIFILFKGWTFYWSLKFQANFYKKQSNPYFISTEDDMYVIVQLTVFWLKVGLMQKSEREKSVGDS